MQTVARYGAARRSAPRYLVAWFASAAPAIPVMCRAGEVPVVADPFAAVQVPDGAWLGFRHTAVQKSFSAAGFSRRVGRPARHRRQCDQGLIEKRSQRPVFGRVQPLGDRDA